jgi:hypothetical protein
MNPRDLEDVIERLTARVSELEKELARLGDQAKVVRVVAVLFATALIGLIVNALGQVLGL